MNFELQIEEGLYESFRAALVLTGSTEAAERAITIAIDSLGSEFSAPELLVRTAQSALMNGTSSGTPCSVLPLELQALSLFHPTRRHAFILRVLLGLDLETCSEILRLFSQEVEEAVHELLPELPWALEFARCTGIVSVLRHCDPN